MKPGNASMCVVAIICIVSSGLRKHDFSSCPSAIMLKRTYVIKERDRPGTWSHRPVFFLSVRHFPLRVRALKQKPSFMLRHGISLMTSYGTKAFFLLRNKECWNKVKISPSIYWECSIVHGDKLEQRASGLLINSAERNPSVHLLNKDKDDSKNGTNNVCLTNHAKQHIQSDWRGSPAQLCLGVIKIGMIITSTSNCNFVPFGKWNEITV